MDQKDIFNVPLDRKLEQALGRLVEKGCDRQALLALAVGVFGSDKNLDQFMFYGALGDTERDPRPNLKTLLARIEIAARDIERINEASLLGAQGLRILAGPNPDAARVARTFERLPETLRLYCAAINLQLDIAQETFSLKGRPSRKIILLKFMEYVKDVAKAPNRNLISEFLVEFAAMRNIDDISGLDIDSLEQLYRRRKVKPKRYLR